VASDHCNDILLLPDVARDGEHLRARGPELLCGALELVQTACADRQREALLDEDARDREPDTARAPGDERRSHCHRVAAD